MNGAPARHLDWSKGGHAAIVSVEGDQIALASTTPAPPGARLVATLASEPAVPVTIKSHGTRREPDGTFSLTGRLVDATRELRSKLAAVAAGGAPR